MRAMANNDFETAARTGVNWNPNINAEEGRYYPFTSYDPNKN